MVDRVFGDMHTMNKTFKYYTEFDVDVTSIDDIEDIKEELEMFHMRIMSVPSFKEGDVDLKIRIDMEDLDEVSKLADVLFEFGYISEEDYMNFEENTYVYD